VFDGERVKIITVYAVLSAGQSERGQVTFFDPSQYRYFAYTAMPGDRAGGQILWVIAI
jgi:hypothetical protein